MNHGINIPREAIAAYCRRHLIARLSLYGSVLRDDFGPERDVDILVELQPEAEPSLLDLGGMQQELCDRLGRQVDLETADFHSPYIRERVLQEARVQYAA